MIDEQRLRQIRAEHHEQINAQCERSTMLPESNALLENSGLGVSLPCPFCGAKPHHNVNKVRYCQMHGEPSQDHTYKCPRGCAQMTDTTREKALQKWNARAIVARKPEGEIAELIAFLRSVNAKESPYANDLVRGWCHAAADAPAAQAAKLAECEREEAAWRVAAIKKHREAKNAIARAEAAEAKLAKNDDACLEMMRVNNELRAKWNASEENMAELEREESELHKHIDRVFEVVSGDWFLVPPDGGDVKLHEGVKRIEDAWKAAEARNAALVESLKAIRKSLVMRSGDKFASEIDLIDTAIVHGGGDE